MTNQGNENHPDALMERITTKKNELNQLIEELAGHGYRIEVQGVESSGHRGTSLSSSDQRLLYFDRIDIHVCRCYDI